VFIVHDLKLAANERTLRVAVGGRGRDIVLIHGALTTHIDWMGGVFERLAETCRVLAVDRPGHGGSRRPRFVASPMSQAAHIRDGLQQLDVSSPILIGHSFGAMVALAWAAEHPQEVAGLVLAAPIAFPEWRPFEHSMFGPCALPYLGPIAAGVAGPTLDRALLPAIQRLMFSPQAPPEGWLQRYPEEEVLRTDNLVCEGEDVAAMTPGAPTSLVNYYAIEAPVRILTGDRDRIAAPLLHGLRLAATLPRAESAVLPGKGHMLHHVATEAVVEAALTMSGQTAAPQASPAS
jgi:pimeloyl-ACP methyl ester carboxylesterase